LKEENARIKEEKARIEEEAALKRAAEDKNLLDRRMSFNAVQGEGMNASDALKAQLEAAKEFIRQNEIEVRSLIDTPPNNYVSYALLAFLIF